MGCDLHIDSVIQRIKHGKNIFMNLKNHNSNPFQNIKMPSMFGSIDGHDTMRK